MSRVIHITIWEPRWHTREVLVGIHHIHGEQAEGVDNFSIDLVNSNEYNGHYPITREEITSFPIGSNGKIPCYEVPLDWLIERKANEHGSVQQV